jgi:hypothetical protein
MTKVYILRALGFGDDEDAFENMGAFTTQEKAQAQIELLRVDDQDLDIENVYDIEVLDLE